MQHYEFTSGRAATVRLCLLFGLVGCSSLAAEPAASDLQPQAKTERPATSEPEVTTQGSARPSEEASLYQQSRDSTIARRRKQHGLLVERLHLAESSRTRVLEVLEDQLQASMSLAEYRREHPELKSADLERKASDGDSAALSELLTRANPNRVNERLRAVLSEEEYRRYREVRSVGLARLHRLPAEDLAAVTPAAPSTLRNEQRALQQKVAP